MKLHNIIFYLDPLLITPTTAIDLSRYVADMNAILSKNTDRRLVFDLSTGIIPSLNPPQDDTYGTLPSEGFDIWVHAVYSGLPNYTTGGYIGVNSGGQMVLAGMRWGGIYSQYSADYSKQVWTMLHELAHGFNAGIGEYYSLIYLQDMSAREPLQNIEMLNGTDPFRLSHSDWIGDPLLWNVSGATRADFLAACRYSELTARVINSTWRTQAVTFDSFVVQVGTPETQAAQLAALRPQRVSGVPVRDVPYTVYVYSKDGQLIQQGSTGETGRFTVTNFGWFCHNANHNARLVEVFQGSRFVGQHWVTVYDLDLSKLRGEPECVVRF